MSQTQFIRHYALCTWRNSVELDMSKQTPVFLRWVPPRTNDSYTVSTIGMSNCGHRGQKCSQIPPNSNKREQKVTFSSWSFSLFVRQKKNRISAWNAAVATTLFKVSFVWSGSGKAERASFYRQHINGMITQNALHEAQPQNAALYLEMQSRKSQGLSVFLMKVPHSWRCRPWCCSQNRQITPARW